MKKQFYISFLTLVPFFILNCGGDSSNTVKSTPVENIGSLTNTTVQSINTLVPSNITKLFELPSMIGESSSLINMDNQLWTHNDRGGEAKLYQIDKKNGSVLKTVTINNATNYDWEELTFDDTYLYIGDFGNNKGNRTNLKIYKILRSDLQNNNAVDAEIINFSYSDQTDFSKESNNNNYDCEAFVASHDKLYLFSKNWVNHQTRLYELDNTTGTNIANYQSSFDIQGLVTGASINPENDTLVLTTYSDTLDSNIWLFSNYNNNNFFEGEATKIPLETPLTAQIEGVTFVDAHKVYLSSETVSYSIFTLPASMYVLDFSKLFE